jgi:hypothetical protein
MLRTGMRRHSKCYTKHWQQHAWTTSQLETYPEEKHSQHPHPQETAQQTYSVNFNPTTTYPHITPPTEGDHFEKGGGGVLYSQNSAESFSSLSRSHWELKTLCDRPKLPCRICRGEEGKPLPKSPTSSKKPTERLLLKPLSNELWR